MMDYSGTNGRLCGHMTILDVCEAMETLGDTQRRHTIPPSKGKVAKTVDKQVTDMIDMDLIQRFKQPAYTGANRCFPCTIANIGIAGLVSVVIGVLSLPAGLLAFLGAAVVIYLRGYLIPGTPRLTKQYFPEQVLALFDKAPPEIQALPDDHTIEETLFAIGVIEECPDQDDLCLHPGFRKQWYARIDRLDSATAAADTTIFRDLDIDRDRITLQSTANAYAAYIGDRQISRWESQAAYIADVAADHILSTRVGDWDQLSFERRLGILSVLRLWLEQCPDCGGTVTLGERTVESCCRSYDVIAGSCEDCGSRVFEAQVQPNAPLK